MKKRKDGRYQKKVILPDGQVKFVYDTNPAGVNAKAKALIKEAETGVKVGDNTKVGEWATEWFQTYKSSLREHTIASYMNSYNNHIAPFLENMPIKSVRPLHVQKVMNEIACFSEDLQRKVLNTMKQIFDTAIQNRLIAVNPCTGIKITPHATDERIKVLSEAQQDELLKKVEEPRAKLFVALGLYCGLRREESLGLMWSDIHGDMLTVNRAITFIKNQPDPDQSLKSKAAHRDIPIPTPLKAVLDATPKTSLYLITNAKGETMTLTAYRRLWGHVTRSVDFDVHSHMLRHSYATSLYKGGIDLKTAQYLLGHSDIKMTAEIYTHIEQDQVKSAGKKINAFFANKSKSSQNTKKRKKA